jgi:hypothetical protein
MQSRQAYRPTASVAQAGEDETGGITRVNLTDPAWHGPGNVVRLSMVRTAATPGPHDRRMYLALGVYSIQAHYSLKRRARAAPVRPAGYAHVDMTSSVKSR